MKMEDCKQCCFCFGSTNNGICGVDKKLFQNIFECSVSHLKEEIIGRDSFDLSYSEGLLSPICVYCFKSAKKIHEISLELERLEKYLQILVDKFKQEVKLRGSENVRKISNNDPIKEEKQEFIPDETDDPLHIEPQEINYVAEEILGISTSHSEDEIENDLDFIKKEMQDIPYHVDTEFCENKSEYVSHSNDEKFSPNPNDCQDSKYVNSKERNTTLNADLWPRVVLKRLQMYKNGEVISADIERAKNKRLILRKRKAAVKHFTDVQNSGAKFLASTDKNRVRNQRRRLRYLKSVMVHKDIEHGRTYSCGTCAKVCKSKYSLEIHSILTNHRDGKKERISCGICGRLCSKHSLRRHESTHNSAQFKCSKCSKMFKTQRYLKTHMVIHNEKLFSCDSCGKCFPKNGYLKMHKFHVHSAVNIKCEYLGCGKIFNNAACLRGHFNAVHRSTKRYVCEKCGVILATKTGLKLHIDVIHKKILKYVCTMCGKYFGTAYNLRKHEEIHRQDSVENKFKCEICGDKYFTQPGTLLSHQRQWHTAFINGPITCHNCENKFDEPSALFLHTKKETQTVRTWKYKCEICKEISSSRCEFLIHTKKDHPSVPLPYQCQNCYIVFNTAKDLREHTAKKHNMLVVIKKHWTPKRIKKNANSLNTKRKPETKREKEECDICGKEVKIKCLEAHRETHSAPSTFLCTLCGKILGSKIILQRHESHCPAFAHTKNKKPEPHATKHMCSVCNKSFTSARSLRIHAAIHMEEKPFTCATCGKGFAQPGNLKSHLNIHTGAKPYTCDVCSRTFANPANLAKHKLLHTGEKPHKCTFCEKSFAQSNALQTHLRLHTGEKPYICAICGKTFSDRSTWYKHEKNHK